MRKTLALVLVSLSVALCGCAFMDKILSPPKPGAPSPAQKTVQGMIESGTLSPTTGEMVLGGLGILQNLYLATRKVQKGRAAKKSKAKAVEVLETVAEEILIPKETTSTSDRSPLKSESPASPSGSA